MRIKKAIYRLNGVHPEAELQMEGEGGDKLPSTFMTVGVMKQLVRAKGIHLPGYEDLLPAIPPDKDGNELRGYTNEPQIIAFANQFHQDANADFKPGVFDLAKLDF